MGRPPSNGGPSFRFNQAEITEMETILQAHKAAMPAREVLVSLAEKFSNTEERKGKIEVQMKQVWNWFQNRRYAIRAKAAKSPGNLNLTQMNRDDSGVVKGVPQATQPHTASSTTVRSLPQVPQHPTGPSAAVRTFPQGPPHPAVFSVQSAGKVTDNSQMEYEAKSARDGAWYDVSTFLSHRSLETGDTEVLVRFAGFGAEEDEWVNVRKNVRQRSLPCESSECVAVLPGDLILCFQEGKEQALYFDAHVLDAQRRRHDVRGCRCRFLVRYDHDQSEEIVALRKICRRPETDYRLQQLHAVNESLSANHNKNGANNIHTVSTLRVYPPAEVQQPKQHKVEHVVPSLLAEVPQKLQRVDSTVPAPQPEGSQQQVKVESAVLASQSDVLQDQTKVQHAVPAPSSEVPQYQHKVEPVKPNPSAQDSAESRSVEVPLELPKVQPLKPDPSDEAKQEVQTTVMVPPSSEVSPIENAATSTEIAVEAPVEVEPRKVEPEEPVVPGSSPEVPTDLHEVQPALEAIENKAEEPMVPVSTSDPNIMETRPEEPMVPVSTSEPNVVKEAIGTKPEEPMVPVSSKEPDVVEEPMGTKPEEPMVPVSTGEPDVVEESMETKTAEPMVPVCASESNVVEAEIQQPKHSETRDRNEDKHANVAENARDEKVGNPNPKPENASENVTGTDTCDMEEG